MHHDDALARLRRRLATSSEARRPVARPDLPLKLGHLVTEGAVALLKPAAVLVPILRRPHGHTVLLTKRAEHLRAHKGQISFPGGRRDDSDGSYASAALREAHEEVGLPPQVVSVIGYLDDHPTFTGYRITPVVGYVDAPDFAPVTDPGEVAAAFELPLGYITGDDCFARKRFTRGGLDIPFLEIEYEGHQIWGATAAILWNLREQFLSDDGA